MPSSSTPVVLVVGASRGIGLAIVQYLLHASPKTTSPTISKSNVITLSRSLPSELKDLQSKHGEQLECVQGDILEEKTHKDVVDKALAKWGRLDGVVLNAGIIEFGRLADAKPESFARQINTNLTSLFTTLHYTLPSLRKAPSGLGRIIFVSSGAAVGNYSAWSAYNASKAGLNALARTVASEEKENGVAVWSIRPGVVDTGMQSDIRSKGTELGMDSSAVGKFTGMHQRGELLQPQDPAHVLAALVTRGTFDNPKTKDGGDAGKEGAFISWDEDVLKEFRRE